MMTTMSAINVFLSHKFVVLMKVSTTKKQKIGETLMSEEKKGIFFPLFSPRKKIVF